MSQAPHIAPTKPPSSHTPGSAPSGPRTASATPAAASAATGIPTGLSTAALATPPTLGGRVSAALAGLRRALAGTPGRMRLLSLAAVAVAITFGLTAGQTFRAADAGLGQAEANTRQLVRIQAIHTNLMRADADATNAFLVGGLEPADRRADYTGAVAQSSKLIAEAARAQPADENALATLNQAVVSYTGLVEQARANNRQGLPVGAQYLRDASSGLRAGALPILDNLVQANEQRARDEFAGSAAPRVWLAGAGLIAVLVLLAGMVWLARRTHRYVNLPLAGATVAVLVMTIAGFAALSAVNGTVSQARDGAFSATLSTARARIAAYDAKSNESLTLIARGSGSAFEAAWKKSSGTVTTASDAAAKAAREAAGVGGTWTPYVQTHTAIRAADDNGDWEKAVSIATGTGAGTANATFDGYDTKSGQVLADVGSTITDALSAPRGWLPFVGWLGLLVGLLAAVGAWWGVSLRLEEYR